MENSAKRTDISAPHASQAGAQVLPLVLCAAVSWIHPGDLGRKGAIARHLCMGNLS